MAASPDLLSKISDELDARLRELRPLVAEYESLLVAASALAAAGEEEISSARGGAGRAAARKVSAPASIAPARRRGRPPGKRSSARSAPEPAPVAGASTRAPSKPTSRRRAGAPKRAQRGAAAVAILAALEHGSHTVSELAVVTAMRGPIVNNNLRRLQQVGTVTRTKREGDGKAAYALTATPA
jgi:hypothetical protein